MRKWILKPLLAFIVLFIAAPVAVGAALAYSKGWPSSWRTADWSSAGVLPGATENEDAVVYVMAGRSGRWKGIFAVHHWLVVKERGGFEYDRYEVVGWGRPVRKNAYDADGRWYSSVPEIVHEVRGEKAEKLIPRIRAAIDAYPWSRRGSYTVWPGPNSNTFVAHVARQVPELGAELDPAGVGKDWLGPGFQTSTMPSGSGWQISWNGWIGAGAAWREGIELHVLGSTIGVDFARPAIKLPSLGRVGMGG